MRIFLVFAHSMYAYSHLQVRALQAQLFSVVTGDYYQHVLQYLGNEQFIHTHGGVCTRQHVSTLPPLFVESCAIMLPNKELIMRRYNENSNSGISSEHINNAQDFDVSSQHQRLTLSWEDFWETKLKPAIMRADGARTDVIGICLTPLKRSRPLGNYLIIDVGVRLFSITCQKALLGNDCNSNVFLGYNPLLDPSVYLTGDHTWFTCTG